MAKLARLPIVDRTAGADADHPRIPRLRTRYYAFLSYSHKDKELADWLHRELEKFRVPHALAGKLTANGVVPRRLSPVFRDQQDLSAGGDLAEEIKAALAASQFLVVLCSPTAAKSRWTNQEIESFKRTRPEGCVLAAVASGEPFASDLPGHEDEECFPPALRYKYDRRGHQTAKRAEPLAADFREAGEGKRVAFLKLVAGMLGVGLDELVQREQTRRHRQLAWLAAGSLAGMAVTSTLAVAAFEARNEARDQRRQAEGLVAFMVGDLRDKLEPIGKLDVLDGVGSRVLAYYSRQDTSQLTDDALMQRSRALNLMAEVAYNRGNLDQAQGLYRQAMAGTVEAVRRSPEDPKRLFDHAQNVFWVGEVARYAGRPVEAEAGYREYKRIADKMVALEPDNLKYRMEVLYADEDLGISLYDQHRFPEANRQFQDALGPMEKLASLYPANVTYQKELSTELAWLADAQRSEGHLDDAIDVRERQISSLNRLVDAAADSDVRARLITAHQGLGVVLAERGQSDRSVQELHSAVDEAEGLIPIEPRNANWKSLAAAARLELARTLLSLGRHDEAAQQAAAGCTLWAAIPASFAVSARTRLQTACAMVRSRLALAGGDTQQAMKLGDEALASARTGHSEDPITDRYRLAMAYRLVGDVRQRAGDYQAAKAAWSSALEQLPPTVAERPWEMNERAELLRRLGRAGEAAVLSSRLGAIGYQSVS
jgi:eukaryotic-like serine/threonine-protein kinase